MIINVHGKNLEITPAIEAAVQKSLARIEKFKKFVTASTIAKVDIRSYPERTFKVTVNIMLPYQKHLHCEETNADLYVAIKAIVHPLENQLNHFKKSYRSNKVIDADTEAILLNNDPDDSEYRVEDLTDAEDFVDIE